MVLSDTDLWVSTGRLVHRKLEELPTAGDNNKEALTIIGQQFAVDRAAMEQMFTAIQSLAQALNGHDGDLREHDRRLEEHTAMRFDDNKLRSADFRHIRTGLESLDAKVTAQDNEVYDRLSQHMDEMVPRLIAEESLAVESVCLITTF